MKKYITYLIVLLIIGCDSNLKKWMTYDEKQEIEENSNSKIKKLIVTDTIDNSGKTNKINNIEVLSIANLMGEAIKRISNSTSVSDLFK